MEGNPLLHVLEIFRVKGQNHLAGLSSSSWCSHIHVFQRLLQQFEGYCPYVALELSTGMEVMLLVFHHRLVMYEVALMAAIETVEKSWKRVHEVMLTHEYSWLIS